MVQLRDVAGRLKLSITTVSRALDGYGDVAEATRTRVVRAARQMGYTPSRAARQLRRHRADVVGYVLPASQGHFADSFFAEFIAGLGDGAVARGFDLLVSTAAPKSAAERQIYRRWIQSSVVDGFILSRMRVRDWRVVHLAKEGVPFVAHGRAQPRAMHPYIEVDSRAGFAQMVAHLAGRGFRRIAYVGASPDIALQIERSAGYREGLAAAGIPFDDSLVLEGDLTRKGGYSAALRLLALDSPPTAIVGANDLTAIGALRAAREKGLTVGRDIAIAGYDGTEESANTQPPLTTLQQPIYETARSLVDMLVARVGGESLKDPHVVLQPRLIIRESTGG